MKHFLSLRSPERQSLQQSQAGFTIVELMIATLIFSVVLVVITFGVLFFTNSYYKGVNSSSTQVSAQNALDTITQAIQFSSGGTVGTASVFPADHFCAGSKLFLYSSGKLFTGVAGPANWGLYMLDNPSVGTCVIPSPVPSGTELLDNNTRLVNVDLAIDPSAPGPTPSWELSLKIAFGGNDVLCSPSVAGSCASSVVLTNAQLSNPDVLCRSQTGSQFCAVSALSTVAQQRVVN